jgi:hypothetical protein
VKVGDLVTLSNYGNRILALREFKKLVGVVINIEYDKFRDRPVYFVLFTGYEQPEMLYRKEIKYAR